MIRGTDEGAREPRLRITQRARGGVCVLALAGRLDGESSPALRESLRALSDGRTGAVLLDLGALEHIGTAGVATLVEAQRRFAAFGGTLGLFRARRPVKGLFEIFHLDRAFRFFPDEESALAAAKLA